MGLLYPYYFLFHKFLLVLLVGALLGTGGYQQDTELDTEEKEVEVAGVDQRSSEYCTLPDSSSTEPKEKESVSVGFGTVAPRPSSTSPQSSSFHPSNSSSTNATATPLAKCITPEFEGRALVPLSVSSQNTTVSGQNSSGMLNQSQSSRSSQPSSGTSVAASSFVCFFFQSPFPSVLLIPHFPALSCSLFVLRF